MMKDKYDRKIPLLNEFYCRGRIIGKGGSKNKSSYLTVFIKTKRKPTYLKIFYNAKSFPDFKLNTHISVKGFIKSSIIPYKYENQVDQCFVAEEISIETTEISEVFEIDEIGFAYKHSYSKVFLSGYILNIRKNLNWIVIQVRDYREQVITLQFSTKMRVSDVNLNINDFVFLSAVVVSSRKKRGSFFFFTKI